MLATMKHVLPVASRCFEAASESSILVCCQLLFIREMDSSFFKKLSRRVTR